MRFPLLGTVTRCGPGGTTLTIELGITSRIVMFELATWRELIGHRGLDRLKGCPVLLEGDLLAFTDERGVWWPTCRKWHAR